MPVLSIRNLFVSFGAQALFEDASLMVTSGQKIALIGRNGEGKSTLLKIINGQQAKDNGAVKLDKNVTVATLEQKPNIDTEAKVFDVVLSGLGEVGKLIQQYQTLSANSDLVDLDKLGSIQAKLDAVDGWNFKANVDKTLYQLQLDPEHTVSMLSGGWQRRVALARALVCKPKLLLLDEPTNHLDIGCIEWLEKRIRDFQGAVIFVTHDRSFLKNVATDIVELDRGKLMRWPGNYHDYLHRKAATLEQEERQNANFSKNLCKEEAWIRQGIKARRTRNEGRVRALKKLREQHAARRQQKRNVNLMLEQKKQGGKVVIEAKSVRFKYDKKNIVNNFTTRILRGDRIGLIGENGTGKSSLIKLLLGELQPNQGEVIHGTNLDIAYFDQYRKDLPQNQTIIDIVGQGSDRITINGKSKHIISYVSDFLFSPTQARAPIRALSGGECARVLLAKLFSKPTNVLVMDEPTNDLDIETLELLEELLMNYQGTLILVSHDRQFLDNVVTSTFFLSGNGEIIENVGGYSDWLKQVEDQQKEKLKKQPPIKNTNSTAINQIKKKLSYKEQRALNQLPNLIDQLEKQQAALTQIISQTDFYSQAENKIEKTLRELKSVEKQIESSYQRWSELESG